MVFTNYHAPADYRRPAKTIEKIYVPVNDYPEINFSKLTLDSICFNVTGRITCQMFSSKHH